MANMICPACRDAGGFNIFKTVQGEGTSSIWIHEWLPCSLCGIWRKLQDEVANSTLRVKELEAEIEQLRQPRRQHRKKEITKES